MHQVYIIDEKEYEKWWSQSRYTSEDTKDTKEILFQAVEYLNCDEVCNSFNIHINTLNVSDNDTISSLVLRSTGDELRLYLESEVKKAIIRSVEYCSTNMSLDHDRKPRPLDGEECHPR